MREMAMHEISTTRDPPLSDTEMAALLKVLRKVAQIEDGREDVPLEEEATAECQRRGWLDDALQLTDGGRVVLTVHQGSQPSEE
jgi:hypothetical protein